MSFSNNSAFRRTTSQEVPTMRETRVLPGSELRSVDTRRREVEARVATYGISDHHGTVWRPGCFTDSLQRTLPPVCLDHRLDTPWGRVVDYDDTSRALDV